MNQGCHVLVEKPMALTVAEAQEMADAAKRNGVKSAWERIARSAVAAAESAVPELLDHIDA